MTTKSQKRWNAYSVGTLWNGVFRNLAATTNELANSAYPRHHLFMNRILPNLQHLQTKTWSQVWWKPVTQSVIIGKDPLHTLVQVPMHVEEAPTPLHEGISVMQQQLNMEPASSTPWPKHDKVLLWCINTPQCPQLCQDMPELANHSDIMCHTIDDADTTLLMANPHPRLSQMGTNNGICPIACASTTGDPQEASRMRQTSHLLRTMRNIICKKWYILLLVDIYAQHIYLCFI